MFPARTKWPPPQWLGPGAGQGVLGGEWIYGADQEGSPLALLVGQPAGGGDLGGGCGVGAIYECASLAQDQSQDHK